MTYDQIVRKIAAENGISLAATRRIIGDLKDIIRTVAHRDGRVRIPGIGTFKRRDLSPRTVFVPSTGAKVERPSRVVIRLKADKRLCRA